MDPYRSSTDNVAAESRPRVAHSVVAMSSAVFCAICFLTASFRLPTSSWFPGVSDFQMFAATIFAVMCTVFFALALNAL